MAGYPLILVRCLGGDIKAFHDIWSGGFNDKLAQAVIYEGSENLLRSFHVHLDTHGFIWVNLGAGEQPEIPWDRDFKDIDLQPRFKDFNCEDCAFDHTWRMDGPYNWKILADDYNE